MAGFNPGQAFLMAKTRPILGAPPIDLVQGQYGPNVAMNLGGVKNIVGNAGNKVMQFLNQLNQGPFPGSPDDPRDPQGSRIINGMHEDLYNADPGYQKRYIDSLGL